MAFEHDCNTVCNSLKQQINIKRKLKTNMSLLPIEEKGWTFADVFQWLVILTIICVILTIYNYVVGRFKRGILGSGVGNSGLSAKQKISGY